MESTDLDMGEIFDDDSGDEDDIGAIRGLPDLPESSGTPNNEEDENAEVLARLKDLSKGAAKKVSRKPQPKLDSTRLTGERGIPILPNLFKNVKLCGKGHESEDLAKIMREMEHWAHRLFPKMPFDEVIERCEKLGSKREVQTCVRKMRLDMPILNNDFVDSDNEQERGKNEQEFKESEPDPDDMWDQLMHDKDEALLTQQESRHALDKEVGAGLVSRSPVAGPSGTSTNHFSMPRNMGAGDFVVGLTPEQRERIERNKQLAMEKRLKKTAAFTPGTTHNSQLSVKSSDKQSQWTMLDETPLSCLPKENIMDETVLSGLNADNKNNVNGSGEMDADATKLNDHCD